MAKILAVSFLAISACGGVGPLTPRASFDLDCPEEALRITEIDDDTFGAVGCGKRATYVKSCTVRTVVNTGNGQVIPVKKCQWVRN